MIGVRQNSASSRWKPIELWLLQPVTEDDLWEDEAFLETPHPHEEGFVFVDPHILCNPAIGDIDADGHDELVVAVSYFFDQEYYSDPVRPLTSPAPQHDSEPFR